MSDAPEPTIAADEFDYEKSVGMLCIAVGGSALAGAAFPVVIAVADAVGAMWNGLPIRSHVALIIIGGMVGFMLAFVVAVLLAIVAVLVAWLCSLPAGTVWYESLVGGWAGFFAAHLLVDHLNPLDDRLLLGLAVVTGQLGAGGAVYLAQPRQRTDASSPEGRVGLRQLFGITTAIALLAAIGRGIEVESLVYSTLWLAVAIQSSLITLWFFCCAMTRKVKPERASFT